MGFWRNLFFDEPQGEGKGANVQALGAEGQFYDISDPRIVDFLREGNPTASGRYVTEASAMKNPTFNRAVTVISQTIGMLPINLLAKDEDGKVEKATAHAAHALLRPRGKPNEFQNPFEFKTYMQGRALLHGDAFAHVVHGVGGKPIALIPMDPKRVEVKLTDDYRLEYRWKPSATGESRLFQSSEVLHLRSPWSSDGCTGEGLIKLLGEALGLAEAADEAASRLLRNGAYVGGKVTMKKSVTEPAFERLKAQFNERHSGPENAGKWLLLEDEMDAEPFGMTGRDAQGLENRKYQAEEVSRGTGVPRPLLMFDETSWGSGIEQLGLFFITYCLAGWFIAWEEALARSLLTDAERETHQFKFNEAALLRGSLKDQADFLSKAIGGPGQGGFLVPNEAREKMDINKSDDPAMDRPAWVQEVANEPSE